MNATEIRVEVAPELHLFVPSARRAGATALGTDGVSTLGHVIESLGVPLTEVGALVVDGHSVHRSILETAQSIGADLIVMGSHGRRGIEKLVLGSVTQRVLGDTHLPVLVVRD